MLEIKNLNKYYPNGLHALKDVSFSVPEGEFLVVIGLSGSGKSTMLRCVNRLHDSTSGEILFNGVDTTKLKGRALREMRANIGMIFQHFNLIPRKTVMQNVLMGNLSRTGIIKSILGIHTPEVRAQAMKYIEIVGLKGKEKNRADNLSGGQQQRLVIARSLAVQPHVLLMDEPCSALDPASTLKIEETIRELSRTVTIIIVTHNMQQAVRVSDYTAFFLAAENEPGHVVEQGLTNEIFSNPQDQRTLDYVNGRFG